ncbi:hypothetical protein B0J12DRAFT_672950 [Macrophomina phaseolina]|uniref:Letm1 RBD domain-containing protein n=1 Tax=Macrophomina phaseolina TaxID=35725 RepID=A0ABQ8G2H9_9PEZI|nr:hypothetical protein B0J12DRAFT_672950 [Macrophomina phaseolina]
MIPRIGSALVAPSPFALPALQLACKHSLLRSRLLRLAPVRHASTATATAPSNPPPSSREDRANPPASTLPAPVNVPARAPDQSLFNYALKSGKAYLQFYKTGVKNVWSNRKLAAAVKQRLRQSPAAAAITRDLDVSRAPFTRGEFQLLRRSRYDMRRVPVFGVLFLIIGEWLPLVAVFVTSLVPVPCRIPKQIEKEERRRDGQRSAARAALLARAKELGVPVVRGSDNKAQSDAGLLSMQRINPKQVAENVFSPDKRKVAHPLYLQFAVSAFNVRWPLLDRTGIVAPWLLQLRKHLMYLAIDDALLARDGGAGLLRPDEVRVACSERGIDVTGRQTDELRNDLKAWVSKKKSAAWLNALYSPSEDKPVVAAETPKE